jgi:hypothetical protein
MHQSIELQGLFHAANCKYNEQRLAVWRRINLVVALSAAPQLIDTTSLFVPISTQAPNWACTSLSRLTLVMFCRSFDKSTCVNAQTLAADPDVAGIGVRSMASKHCLVGLSDELVRFFSHTSSYGQSLLPSVLESCTSNTQLACTLTGASYGYHSLSSSSSG